MNFRSIQMKLEIVFSFLYLKIQLFNDSSKITKSRKTNPKKKINKNNRSDRPSEERYLSCLGFNFDNCLCVRKVTQIFSVIISVFHLNSIEVISRRSFSFLFSKRTVIATEKGLVIFNYFFS